MGWYENYGESYKNCQWIDFSFLERFMKDALVANGVPPEDATIIGDVLIESDKRGIDSHGIGRLKPIYIDRINWGILNPVTKVDKIKETETTAVLDGNNGMGHVVSKQAMELAMEKAGQFGMGMVAVRNSTHYG
ncbi:MAG: Ldh family oxidoreductase, partial [Spirochaetales bacterium]|nr:Ldh family oxidoreductase [Spirochaetales bacterium]